MWKGQPVYRGCLLVPSEVLFCSCEKANTGYHRHKFKKRKKSVLSHHFKIWPHKEYPLIPVGKIVLNRNPVNYFAEVEQLAFDPSNMPPGIEPSPDKMLQVRPASVGDKFAFYFDLSWMFFLCLGSPVFLPRHPSPPAGRKLLAASSQLPLPCPGGQLPEGWAHVHV